MIRGSGDEKTNYGNGQILIKLVNSFKKSYIYYYSIIKGLKVVIMRYQFSSDIVKTLPIYYIMLLENMCEVLKLLTIQNPRKLSLKIKMKQKKERGGTVGRVSDC